MKLSDYETSTRIEFKTPRSFSRQQRLKLVATAYAHLTEWTSPLPLCERVEGLHDHKGELEVHWITQPTELGKRAVEASKAADETTAAALLAAAQAARTALTKNGHSTPEERALATGMLKRALGE